MRNIKSIYLAGTNVCNLVIVFATLFYLFFALFYCYSLSGVQLKDRSLSPTVEISTILTKKNLWYSSTSKLDLIHSAFDICNQLAASFLAILAYSSVFLHSSSSFYFGTAMLMVKYLLCTANIVTLEITSFTCVNSS